MAYNQELMKLDDKYYKPYFDINENNIFWKYSILIEDSHRFIEIPQKLYMDFLNSCKMRKMQLTDMIMYQYPNKYIHFSPTPLFVDKIEDVSKQNESWLGKDNDKNIYHNPIGLWISCSSAWLDWLGFGCNAWLKKTIYTYEVAINKDTVLRINNLLQFKKFAKKYQKQELTSIREMIDWPSVKNDYDGLIICPYLGEKIWKMKDPSSFYINDQTIDYIETALDAKAFDIDAFAYEWYRHWETDTGVIWRSSGIKSLTLIDENHWYEEFIKELRELLLKNQVNSQPSRAQKEANEKKIIIFTYNVSWQSTSGEKSKWPLCNNTDESNDRYFGICIQNIINVIDDNGPYDFICLQETTNINKIIEKSKILSSMDYKDHKSGPEQIVTFWNKKYKLINKIYGQFVLGRPYQFLFFDNNFCVINLHLPHLHKYSVLEYIKCIFKNINPDLRKYRFIMAGDFNYVLNNPDPKIGFLPSIKIDNIVFNISPEYIGTCCIPPFDEYKLQFDHVLDTFDIPIKTISPTVSSPASDHLPLIAVLNNSSVSTIAGESRIFNKKYIKYKKKYVRLKNNIT